MDKAEPLEIAARAAYDSYTLQKYGVHGNWDDLHLDAQDLWIELASATIRAFRIASEDRK